MDDKIIYDTRDSYGREVLLKLIFTKPFKGWIADFSRLKMFAKCESTVQQRINFHFTKHIYYVQLKGENYCYFEYIQCAICI